MSENENSECDEKPIKFNIKKKKNLRCRRKSLSDEVDETNDQELG